MIRCRMRILVVRVAFLPGVCLAVGVDQEGLGRVKWSAGDVRAYRWERHRGYTSKWRKVELQERRRDPELLRRRVLGALAQGRGRDLARGGTEGGTTRRDEFRFGGNGDDLGRKRRWSGD